MSAFVQVFGRRNADTGKVGFARHVISKRGRCKTVTFDNFCAISLATALEHHSANQFLRAATNLNFVQPKLFQSSRQNVHRFSDCTVSVI
jgi:hypothetical protein